MSNEAKHTPGPWHMHDMESFTVVAGRPGICIAHANALHRSEAENDANARLIAAAPELLEALRPMLQGTYFLTEKHVDAARAAIAKAEGAE